MRKNPWVRFHREALHDPKIVSLSDHQHRAWTNCLLIADDNGVLPPPRDIAVHMRKTITEAEQLLVELVDAELIDADVLSGGRTYRIHAWAKRQYLSDSSTERSRKCRAKKRATSVRRCSNGGATPPDTDTDTDTDNSPPTPSRGKRERENKNQDLVEELEAEGKRLSVVRHLLAPMVKGVKIDHHNPITLLRDIRDHDQIGDLPEAVLHRLAQRIKNGRSVLISTKNILDAVPEVTRGYPKITIYPHSPSWNAWCDELKARGLESAPAYYAKQGSMQVWTEWPPDHCAERKDSVGAA